MKGQIKLKPVQLIARRQRSDVASAELGTGLVAPFTITFTNGETWQFEVSKPVLKDARAVADALGGDAGSA